MKLLILLSKNWFWDHSLLIFLGAAAFIVFIVWLAVEKDFGNKTK